MAVKDHTQHFEGIQQAPTPTDLQVPNTVSRAAGTGDRAFIGVVAESGKPVLDAELNLHQQAQWMEDYLLRRWQTPSGWLRGRTHRDAYCDWATEQAPGGVTDDSGLVSSPSSLGPYIHEDGTLLDSLVLPRIEAVVAGHPVVVEFTNTRTPGYNLVGLAPAKVYDGTNATVKRTDFLFLEVWRSLVAPSPRATGAVQVVSVSDLMAGDTLNINGIPLTLVGGPAGVDEFVLGVDEDATATNIANALNAGTNSFSGIVTARAVTNNILLTAVLPGEGDALSQTGNFITLSVTVAVVGSMIVTGATLTGGANRPNKPYQAQDKLFRHGNVLSPEPVWLDDEMVDPIIARESSQRIQLQYRIRATSDSEAVNYKKHPDGFSNLVAGGGPDEPSIFAQGNRAMPVWSGNGVDTVSYPFVPADGVSTWLDTSAVEFGWTDDGLYVAGDGSAEAAANLGAIDGFVFAIPIAFVHRHNNASDVLAGIKGFDPESNVNGAPAYDHAGYLSHFGFAVPPGLSDRPDGHFCNVITQENLLDLRRHVVYPGVDLAAELKYQIQSLMDGNLRTWSVDTSDKQTLGGDSGDVSTRYLICNEIGRTESEGATPPLAGENTERGELIRSYDHIARRFGDQPVIERVVIAFWPGDRNGAPVAPGTDNPGKYVMKAGLSTDTWYEGDVLNLDLEFLNSTTLGGMFDSRPGAGTGGGGSGIGLPDQNFLQFAPAGTVITDVLNAWHDDGHYDAPTDQNVHFGIIKGLGTTHLELTLDANDTLTTEGQPIAGPNIEHKMVGSGALVNPEDYGSPRRIFLEVEITYPIGVGTSDTVDYELHPDPAVYADSDLWVTGPGPLIENDTAQRPADMENLLPARYRLGFREIQTEYIANDTILHAAPLGGSAIGEVTTEQIVSIDRETLRFPRRVWSDDRGEGLYVQDAPTITDMVVDVDNSELGSSSRLIALDTALGGQLSGVGHTLCTIKYFAQDPIPNYGVNGGGYQIAYYFRSNAPQTAGTKDGDISSTGDGTLPTTLQVEPLLSSPSIWTSPVGMGGHDKAYPYAAPLDQIPIHDGTTVPVGPQQISGTTEEWFLCATADVSIADFATNTGLLNLHSFVQQDVQEALTLGGPDNDQKPRKDAEFRAYYPFADDEAYRPVIMAQPLTGAERHKCFVPFLARAVEDVPGVAGGLLFRKSELLLVVLSRFALFDDENNVRFLDPPAANRTLAAVYRTRNLLLTVGDRTCLGS